MPEWVTETAKRVPDLAVLLALVFLFLKFFRTFIDSFAKRSDDMITQHGKRTDEFITVVKELSQDNHEAREQSRMTIEANTRTMVDMNRSVQENTKVTEKMVNSFDNFATEFKRRQN